MLSGLCAFLPESFPWLASLECPSQMPAGCWPSPIADASCLISCSGGLIDAEALQNRCASLRRREMRTALYSYVR
eukprot:11310454-Alexandrium_andersonii.AAC.1